VIIKDEALISVNKVHSQHNWISVWLKMKERQKR